MTEHPGGSERPKKPLPSRRAGVSGSEFAGIGLQFALTIVIFMFAGIWLDRRFGTSWIVVPFVFVGAAGGFYSIYRKLMAAQRRQDDAKR